LFFQNLPLSKSHLPSLNARAMAPPIPREPIARDPPIGLIQLLVSKNHLIHGTLNIDSHFAMSHLYDPVRFHLIFF
jgi:hypothetical protein